MNKRIEKLREESVNTRPSLSIERSIRCSHDKIEINR